MNQSDMPAPAVPSKPEIRSGPVDEAKTSGFWISQLFVLLATVLGVYLASSQGFKQAMAYGELQAGRTNYYLRRSLLDEMAGNMTVLETYMAELKSGAPSARKSPANLDMFVWECLKNSPNTLETPPELLRESRAFYREVDEIQQKIVSNAYAVGFGLEQLRKRVDRMREEILPAFDEDLRKLRDELNERGLSLK